MSSPVGVWFDEGGGGAGICPIWLEGAVAGSNWGVEKAEATDQRIIPAETSACC